MDTKAFDTLMALLSAHALAISALFAVHPQPDEVRKAIATLAKTTETAFDTEGLLLFREQLATFQSALPPH